MMCDKGAAPGMFSPTFNTSTKVNGLLVANEFDKLPIVNIPTFGACSVTGSPCAPVPVAWLDTYPAKVVGGETVLYRCALPCSVGGKIEFVTSGQVPIPPEDMDALMEEHGEPEEEEGGWGWWDTAELIPVVGNVIGMVREGRKGNWGMFALNAAFLVVDVFTLGTGSLVTTPLKGGVKAGVKYAAKTTAKTVAKATSKAGMKSLAKGAGKAFAKAAASLADNIAKAAGLICVYACFPAGTKISAEHGQKNIEDIQIGDRVWAHNPETKKTTLKSVVDTVQKTVDVTVRIKLADDDIETTAEHPFYTREGWKIAAKLVAGDELVTRQGNWHKIQELAFAYERTEVFNFEVEDYHTYFVNAWEWLVHNAKICLSSVSKHFAWGKYYAKLVGKEAPSWMVNPHAHHIVFKKGRGAMVEYLDESKEILERYGIDWLKGAENLVWAPNKNHSEAAARAVRNALKEADEVVGATRDDIVKKLRELGDHFANDTIDTLF